MSSPSDPAPPADTPAPAIPLDHRRRIGRHFYAYTRLRAVVAVTVVAAAFFAHYVLGMESLDVRALTALALWIGLYDAVVWSVFRTFGDPRTEVPARRPLMALTYGAVVLDFFSLTIAIWLVGGARSPFAAFYLLHVMVSCILLSRRAALSFTALAYAVLLLLVGVEWSGLATPALSVGAVAGADPLGSRYALTLVVVYGLLFTLSAYVLLGLTRSLRRAEQRMLLVNAELSRLSEQRKNFLHIAVHNLKAPVGAVSMLLENMQNGLAGDVTEKQRDWLERSLRRLGGLSSFMADLQTLSSLETDIIRAVFTTVELPNIVNRLVEEYEDIAQAHDHVVTVEIEGPVPPVVGHDRLLREAIVNYLTNALKYTPDGGRIVVRVIHRAPFVRVEVADSGIGITPADQARLFREFVRIESKDPAMAKVKGSGLGLSIVDRIVQAHGGRTGLQSRKGEGSTFFLEIPALHI